MKKLLLILCSMCLISCSYNSSSKALSKSAFYFDTSIQITIYEGNTDILEECFSLCEKYELVFSRTNKNSELYKINHRNSNTITISDDLKTVVEKGLEAYELSNHKFDLRIASILDFYDFHNSIIPSKNAITEYLSLLERGNISLKGNTLTFPNEDVKLDLGALAKGYVADKIKEYLLENNVKSALINLGGNILCVGKKQNELWNIGIQKPFADKGDSIYTLKIKDQSIVSSGIYERCFTLDTVFYHHLLDATTALPLHNDLTQVTIITNSSLEADMLSTIVYFMGLEEGMKYIESRNDVEAIFVDYDTNIHLSKGLS